MKNDMDTRKEILSIACDLKEWSITLKEAQTQLLRLLSDAERSESFVLQSVCKCVNYTLEEIFYLKMNVHKCPRCGLKNDL